MVHISSPSIQEVEAGVRGEPGPHREGVTRQPRLHIELWSQLPVKVCVCVGVDVDVGVGGCGCVCVKTPLILLKNTSFVGKTFYLMYLSVTFSSHCKTVSPSISPVLPFPPIDTSDSHG